MGSFSKSFSQEMWIFQSVSLLRRKILLELVQRNRNPSSRYFTPYFSESDFHLCKCLSLGLRWNQGHTRTSPSAPSELDTVCLLYSSLWILLWSVGNWSFRLRVVSPMVTSSTSWVDSPTCLSRFGYWFVSNTKLKKLCSCSKFIVAKHDRQQNVRSTTKLGSYLDRSIRLRVSSRFAYWFVSKTKLKNHIFLCQHIYYSLEMFRTRLRPTLDYLPLPRDYVLWMLLWNLPNAGPYLPRLNMLNLCTKFSHILVSVKFTEHVLVRWAVSRPLAAEQRFSGGWRTFPIG